MFKFTIREMLLLTVVVGLGLAWGVRERHLGAEVTATRGQANALEYLLNQERMTVLWNEDRTSVTVYREGEDDGRAMFVPAFYSPPDTSPGQIDRRIIIKVRK